MALAHCNSRTAPFHPMLFSWDDEPLALINPKVIPLSLLQPLLDAVDNFGAFGVVHTDLNPGNIIFSPGYQPARAAIIDFGEAGVREEEDEFE